MKIVRLDSSDLYKYDRVLLADASSKSTNAIATDKDGLKILGADFNVPFNLRDPRIYFPLGTNGYLPSHPIAGFENPLSAQDLNEQNIVVSPKCYRGDQEMPHPNGGVSGQSIVVCTVPTTDPDFGCPNPGEITPESLNSPIQTLNKIGVLCITGNQPSKPACPTIPQNLLSDLNSARQEIGLATPDYSKASANFIAAKNAALKAQPRAKLYYAARMVEAQYDMAMAGKRIQDGKNREQSTLRKINDFKKQYPSCFD
ncbi:hypothetical protein [Deinococcus arcticus]|uniref:hypothetical protein n=1 Tax=Deinococcus arcticus TaxID=2136176 RepID=UPI0011B256C2|nr:hypothetical protein [Deinococcus arcticus]